MAALALYGNTALHPTILVEMGVNTTVTGYAVWDGALWDAGLWGPDVVWSDITAYVRSIGTVRGRSRDTDRFNTGSMRVVLSNGDDRFTPANLSGPYVNGGVSQIRPGVAFRVTAIWAGVTYPIFYGEADSWGDTYVEMGKDAVTSVTVLDGLAKLSGFDGLAVTAVGAGDLAGARIARLAVNAGFDGALSLDAGVNTMQATTMAQNATQDVGLSADSDGGYVWADATGALVFHDQNGPISKPRSNTSQFTFGPGAGEVIYRDPKTSYDSTLIFNTVSFANVGGSAYTTIDQASVALNKKKLTYRRFDLICQTVAQTNTLADMFLSRHKDAEYRIVGLTVDPAASPSVCWPFVLGALLRDRVTGKVSGPGGTTISRQLFVDGVSHSISVNPSTGWQVSFGFSSASQYAIGAVLGVWNTALWDTAGWNV